MAATPPRLLLTGAGGFLGHHLRNAAKARGFQVFSSQDGLGRLDLEHPKRLQRLALELEPQLVIHAAAIADIAQAKRNPQLAQRVNVAASIELAQAAETLKAAFIFISTDQVFDGRAQSYCEADRPNPLHLYGETKVAVEDWLAQSELRALVLRLPLMVGPSWGARRSASDQIRDAGQRAESLPLFRDEWRRPAHVKDIASALFDLQERGRLGLLHLVGPDLLSRADLGRELALAAGFRPEDIVNETILADHPLAQERPARLDLSSAAAELILGRPLLAPIAAIKELDQTCNDDPDS